MSKPSNDTIKVNWPANSTESEAFPVGNARFGAVQAPAGIQGTAFNYKVSVHSDVFSAAETYSPTDGSAPLANQTINASETHPIPYDVMHANHAKITGDSQNATRIWMVALKG